MGSHILLTVIGKLFLNMYARSMNALYMFPSFLSIPFSFSARCETLLDPTICHWLGEIGNGGDGALSALCTHLPHLLLWRQPHYTH